MRILQTLGGQAPAHPPLSTPLAAVAVAVGCTERTQRKKEKARPAHENSRKGARQLGPFCNVGILQDLPSY